MITMQKRDGRRWDNAKSLPWETLKGISQAYGELIQPFFPDPGSWFMTMTFRDVEDSNGEKHLVHPDTANKCWFRMVHTLNREIFGVRYWKRRQGVIWARGDEYQVRGAIHYHGLIGNVPDSVRRMDYVDYCWEHYGKAIIEKYDSSRGAAFYMSKGCYAFKKGEIVFSDTLKSLVGKGSQTLLAV